MNVLKGFGLLSFGLCLLPLSSCVYDREFTYLNDQIVALNRRVSNIEETLDAKLSRNLDTVLSSQGEMRVDMDRIREELRGVAGRVEDNEHVVKRIVERDLGEQDAMKASLAQVTERVAALDAAVRQQQEYLGLEPPPAKEEPREPSAAPPDQQGPGMEQTGVTSAPRSEEVGLYDASLASFREGKFEDAMAGFRQFLQSYPKSDRADNAHFWIGECHMALKQYEQAILAYQEVIKKYPKGNKVANALLRQALAFLEIKDKTSSSLLLKKIIRNYPNSNEAVIAKKKLKTLN
ncbi:MAG: tol-pal system protein YbgF [Deltaproteobacteria bacterium]|nr:tol-pal system protein YbgF [Deltaproteobacteria bacterium]